MNDIEKRIAEVNDLQNPLFKQVLYVALMDAMAQVAYPVYGNKLRLTSFIKDFSGWNDCERVSLPHLLILLSKVGDPSFDKLRIYAANTLQTWETVHAIPLTEDPDIRKVRSLWPKGRKHDQLIGQNDLESIQHVQLFYASRNSLIHEFRAPGYSMLHRDESYSAPYYHNMIKCANRSGEVEDPIGRYMALVYPTGFYNQLCSTSLTNLAEYMERNKIDPPSRRGSYFLSNLNNQ